MEQNHLSAENVLKHLLLKVIGELMKKTVESFGIALVVQILNTKDLLKIMLDPSEKVIPRLLLLKALKTRKNAAILMMKLLMHDHDMVLNCGCNHIYKLVYCDKMQLICAVEIVVVMLL